MAKMTTMVTMLYPPLLQPSSLPTVSPLLHLLVVLLSHPVSVHSRVHGSLRYLVSASIAARVDPVRIEVAPLSSAVSLLLSFLSPNSRYPLLSLGALVVVHSLQVLRQSTPTERRPH